MDDLTILNEIHKGAAMGMSAISTISEKVGDQEFKDDLSFQYNRYRDSLDKVNAKFEEIGEIPDDTPINQKIMGWTGIQLNTLMNQSNSQIAELLIQGNDMGVVKGLKLLHQSKDISPDVRKIADGFIRLQEDNVQRLKKFL